MAIQMTLSGVRKAAVLTLMLGDELSAQIFKHLREDEIERIAKEVASLGRRPGGPSEKVLEEFHAMTVAAAYVTRGGVEYARDAAQEDARPGHRPPDPRPGASRRSSRPPGSTRSARPTRSSSRSSSWPSSRRRSR